MRDFIITCRRRNTLLASVHPKLYYIEDSELWSLSDLVEVGPQMLPIGGGGVSLLVWLRCCRSSLAASCST